MFSLSASFAANQTITPSSTIQSGINSINTGDTLFLQPGTYNKTNDRGISLSNAKNVTIQGNGSTDSVIIDAQKQNRMFNISNGNMTFINITFINGYYASGTNANV